MKKTLLILLALLLVQAPALAQPAPKPRTYSVVLAGGNEANSIHIWLTPDGRNYVIDSVVPLEGGSTICSNPDGNPNELICLAPSIIGFEVNAGGGDDEVSVAKDILIPVTMRGGAGDDLLIGGAGPDKLIGGADIDRLVGRHGNDALFGGDGRDVLLGGGGDDALRGGAGNDLLRGGAGNDDLRQDRAPRRRQRAHVHQRSPKG